MERIFKPDRIRAYLEQYNIMECFGSSHPEFTLFHYYPGEILVSPFDTTRYLQFIVEGDLLLYEMPSEDSFSMVQSPYYSATVIGEVELIDPEFQPFFVEARTDVYALVLSFSEYRDRLLQDPVFLLNVCRSLSNKLRGAVQTASQVPLKAQILKYLSVTADKSIQDLSHFARIFHVSTRQLYRVLNELVEEGYLEHPRKGIYLVTEKPL